MHRPGRGYHPCTGLDKGTIHAPACTRVIVCAVTRSLRIGGGYCRVYYAPASVAIKKQNARLLVLGVASRIERIHFVRGQCIRQNTTTSIHRYRGASRRSLHYAPATNV